MTFKRVQKWEQATKTDGRIAIAAIAIVAALAIGAALLSGCGKDEVTKILPTVQQVIDPAVCIDGQTLCHDFAGERPDRCVQEPRTERNPKFCFVGDVCFYGCPR